MNDNEIARIVVDSAIEVHRRLGGPGLLEAMLVNERLVVECKAAIAYNTVFDSQALTYLRLSNLQLALVINFGETQVRRGIRRIVNGLRE